MTKKIYIVTSGSYSDYSIHAVFSDKAVAEEFSKTVAYGADVEDWDLDIPPEKWFLTTVDMLKNGDTIGVHTESSDSPDSREEKFSFWPDRVEWGNPPRGGTGQMVLRVKVFTKERERAIRVANEVRAQLIALDRWGTSKGPVKVKE